MAAGSSVRFGAENKLFFPVEGKSLIQRSLEAIPANRLHKVCVVTGYSEVCKIASSFGFITVINDRPEDGISRTIRLGTKELQDECSAILYMVSDQPFLKRSSISGIIDCYASNPDYIVSAASQGKRGNPCIFPQKFFPGLMQLKGDTGGSSIIRSNSDSVLYYELDRIELSDIDTRNALPS